MFKFQYPYEGVTLCYCSSFDGDPNEFDIGDEVEYCTVRKNSKVSAEAVVKLPSGTLKKVEVEENICEGKVVRPLRSSNPEQEEYAGIVQVTTEGKNVCLYNYVYCHFQL